MGLENCEKEAERVSNMIRDGIKPDLVPFTAIEVQQIEDKSILHVTVSRGGRLPYHLSEKGMKPSGVYIRHGLASVPVSEEMIREMIRQSDGMSYDKMRSLNQELTFDYAQNYFKNKNVPFEDKHQRILGLIDQDGYYTNTALLLSDQCEHSLKCAVFAGENKLYMRTRREFTGSLLKQIEEAFEFISLMNNVRTDFFKLERVELMDYPEYAVREALLNMVVHRDYNYSASSIINVFNNRLEFVSLGGLVKGLSYVDILRGASQSRNMTLANIFYRLRLIESYGTGIGRILDSYENRRQPQFLIGEGSFVTVLPNTSYCDIVFNDSKGETDEERVLQLLQNKKVITRRDVEELLHCSGFPARKILNSLIAQGKVDVSGNARATKYSLVE